MRTDEQAFQGLEKFVPILGKFRLDFSKHWKLAPNSKKPPDLRPGAFR
jgi:hypothetical protein